MTEAVKPGAKGKLVLLAVLIATGAGIVLYQYVERTMDDRVRRARAAAQREMGEQIRRAQGMDTLSPQQQAEKVAQAKSDLNQWIGQGNDTLLIQANGLLDQVLRVNPSNVSAHVEMARYYIKNGSSSGFLGEGLVKATAELQTAMRMDPNFADAYVLWGYVLYLRGESRQAIEALQKAAAIGTGNPWLYLNWADALIETGDLSAAEGKLRAVEAELDSGGAKALPGMLVQMHRRLGYVLAWQGKLDQADKEYLSAITLEPGSATNHVIYAYFLLFRKGSPDAAIAAAREALAIGDVGEARRTLAAALYAKWGEERRRKPKEAAKYLALAKQASVDYGWIMPQSAKSVDAGPAILDLVEGLVALGVPIDTRDNNGDSGLTLAADLGNVAAIDILAKHGANLEAADNNGRTALITAAYKGHVEAVRVLAAHGAKVDALDSYGGSALSLAVSNRDPQMLLALLSLKANPNLGSPATGFTPLMNAALVDDMAIARLLIDAGADPNAVMKEKHLTAADFADQRGDKALAQYLREQGARKRKETGASA